MVSNGRFKIAQHRNTIADIVQNLPAIMPLKNAVDHRHNTIGLRVSDEAVCGLAVKLAEIPFAINSCGGNIPPDWVCRVFRARRALQRWRLCASCSRSLGPRNIIICIHDCSFLVVGKWATAIIDNSA